MNDQQGEIFPIDRKNRQKGQSAEEIIREYERKAE